MESSTLLKSTPARSYEQRLPIAVTGLRRAPDARAFYQGVLTGTHNLTAYSES
jgi:hypothetical protein